MIIISADDLCGFSDEILNSWEKEITITITIAIITILFLSADDQRGFSDEVLDSWEEEEDSSLFNFR